jgi:SAM-dependent methyltransferase
MDELSKDFLDRYFFGSYWAFRHYDKIIRRAFNHLPQKPKVAVEVGCGVGLATYFLSKQVHRLICIDTDEECIRRTEVMIKETLIKNVTLMKTDLDRMPLNEEVDLIFFKDALHHLNLPVDYLKSCLPYSDYLLIIEANRYNPILYWICKHLEEEKQFLKMNSMGNILRIVKKAGWRCEKSFYIESAAYPIGLCIYGDVFHEKKLIKTIIKYMGKLYDFRIVSSSIDKVEDLAEKMFKPFCSEFIIIARKEGNLIGQ